MKKLTIIYLAIAIVALGCKSGNQGADTMDFAIEETVMNLAPAERSGMIEKAPQEPVMGEMLIKTVYLGLEVELYSQARLKIDSLVKASNAWISSENFQNYDYSISNDMAIRVPSTNLEGLIQALIGEAKKVTYQRVESTDVTEDYIDVESRLKNLKNVGNTFVKLLRKTDSIEDILKIETKLAEVRGNIESMEGRLKYLKNRVQFSTINLNVSQKIDYKYVPDVADRFSERFKRSLHAGWKGFVGFVLFIIRLWPLWIIAGILWLLWIRYKRIKNIKPVKQTKKEKEREKKEIKKLKKQHQQAERSEEEFGG